MSIILYPDSSKAEQSCTIITGQMKAWNGTPSLRINVRRHLYGVIVSNEHPLPPSLDKEVDFTHGVMGQFTICPLDQPYQVHGMTYVWLQKADNLKVISSP